MLKRRASILILDDERHTREGLQQALGKDYDVAVADNARWGLEQILERDFDLVLTDLRMPGMDGLDFIKRVNAMDNPPGCILLTAYGSRDVMREAQEAGAVMYLPKPIKIAFIRPLIEWFLELRHLKRENRELKRELAARYAFENLIGNAPPMENVKATIRQVAPARTTVLLTGESGTGKELAARSLHQLSDRADKPFVVVHAAALTSSLLASELFGHEKGAFTGASERRIGRFEAADGGTLFLDEIAEIDPAVQVSLLRFLESRSFERVGGNTPLQVDVRLIAATNRDLKAMIDTGDFREDLYYRLNVLQVHMPALRERRQDIPLLLKYYLDIFAAENSKQIAGFAPAAMDALVAYDWPGNVRELRNCVERLVVLAQTDQLSIDDLPTDIRRHVGAAPPPPAATGATLDIEANEKVLIRQALDACDGNRTAAAKRLGISRRTLHRKLNEYHLS